MGYRSLMRRFTTGWASLRRNKNRLRRTVVSYPIVSPSRGKTYRPISSASVPSWIVVAPMTAATMGVVIIRSLDVT
jgi:hypothetical protein